MRVKREEEWPEHFCHLLTMYFIFSPQPTNNTCLRPTDFGLQSVEDSFNTVYFSAFLRIFQAV